jgi:uncharacterized protein (TIGR00661 family)
LKPVVLFGVLNWGLGHASRSIPVINSLMSDNYKVIIVSDGEALVLLKKEFPENKFVNIKGYDVKYPYKSIFLNLFVNSLNIITAILYEKRKITEIITEYNPQFIISDNRYGFRSNKLKSMIICHQINIHHRNRIVGMIANTINRLLLNRFNEIIIPDWETDRSIAGKLSKLKFKHQHKYIGSLSRMQSLNIEKKYKIAIVLSGPEPQRSLFEQILMNQIANLKLPIILVKGIMNENNDLQFNEYLRIKSHALANELNQIICASEIIIARSGYSTIMDLYACGSKAILIPTPGQTEQEYLAQYLSNKKIAYTCNQENFNLSTALLEIEHYSGFSIQFQSTNLEFYKSL